MSMNKMLNLTAVSLFLFISFSCNNDSITQPKEDQPGRRDYIWNIDTISSYDPIFRQ